MEDHEELEEDSSSNVSMLVSHGTFIVDTQDGTVTVVSPERAKNVVWSFFKKYGSKKLKSQDDNLKLAQQSFFTICLAALHSQIGQRQFTVFG